MTGQGRCFIITRKKGAARNFSDVLPEADFATLRAPGLYIHEVRGPRGKRHQATCDLSVHTDSATLDYTAYESENERAGMEIGVMRLHFKDAGRSGIELVEWADGASGRYERETPKIDSETCQEYSPYRPAPARGSRRQRDFKARPGQLKFKNDLMFVYGGECCISGCDIREALDGAHIDPYESTRSDHVQNGLLLRRDLHALFDAGLLRIEPRTKCVELDERVGHYPAYAPLHGQVIRPPSRASAGPDFTALQRRFRSRRSSDDA